MNWFIKENPHKDSNAVDIYNKSWKNGERKAKKNYEKFLKEIRAKKESLIKLKERNQTND